MHAIQILLARPETERLGWVLLHFVWQGAMIAALSAIAFAILRRGSANLRYLIACGALLINGGLFASDVVCCCRSSGGSLGTSP